MTETTTDEGGDVARDDYTWNLAVKDLALLTPLTLKGAGDIVFEMRDLDVHPYDVLPLLAKMFDGSSNGVIGHALADLMRLACGHDSEDETNPLETGLTARQAAASRAARESAKGMSADLRNLWSDIREFKGTGLYAHGDGRSCRKVLGIWTPDGLNECTRDHDGA